MTRGLVQLAALLNELTRRRLEVEAQLRMVTLLTSLQVVQALKREHAALTGRIARLEARLK